MSILNWIELLKDLKKEELDSLEVFCQERFIPKWEKLFLEWDEANSIYFLSSWKIEVYTQKDNKELILWYIKAENILWEMALFWKKSKRMASARTIEDTVVIILLEFSIQQLTIKHPEILEKIKLIIQNRERENEKLLWYVKT